MRPFKVTYKGHDTPVDLPGYYPKGGGDGVHARRGFSFRMSRVEDERRYLSKPASRMDQKIFSCPSSIFHTRPVAATGPN